METHWNCGKFRTEFELAPVRYAINFDGKVLSISGRAKLSFFQPNTKSEAEQFALIAEADNGNAFWKFLTEQKRAQDPERQAVVWEELVCRIPPTKST